MSDFARLNEKLGKLRQVEPRAGSARVLAGQDAASRLRAALTEIDETVLPRRVTFRGAGGHAEFGVANRQLSIIMHGGVPKQEEPHVVDGKEDPILADLHDGLLDLFAGPGPWRIETGRLDREHIQHMRPDAGVSAAVLGAAWDIPLTAVELSGNAADIARRFVDRVADRCDAWLLIEGEEISDSGGSPSAIEWLSERAGGFLDGYYAKRDTFNSGQPLALAFSGGTGASLIYFESGPQAGFATLAPERLGEALGDWTTSLTG